MWQYFWAHAVYHITRWFPRNNRIKIRVVTLLFTFALLLPQILVLARPHSSRFCGQHLFEFLIVSIVFTFCMIGFAILFSVMDPVPWEVKLAFHIYGVVCFIFGIIVIAFTSQAADCRESTQELYWFSLSTGVLGMLTTGFFAVMLPFWIVNKIWARSVLDVRSRTGVCYEPVACCSCVWHI